MLTQSTKRLALNLAFSLTIVAVVTAICRNIGPINSTTAGFTYLVAVLGIASTCGLIEAVVASFVSMLCFNFFFLPPVGQFTIADPQNWVALFAFLVTALVASHLSDLAKKQALEARLRQRETEQLYALSRSILLAESSHPIGSQSAQHIAQIFECQTAALYDATTGDIFLGGPKDLPGLEEKLKQVIYSSNIREPELTVSAITLGGAPIGSLALSGATLSDGALQALLNLVAIALERVRTQETASRAEAARQSEEFKSTLLDAIAHEFKTPLTSIKAAASSMISDSAVLSPQVRELTTIIDEETDRLILLVTEAVRMSQIDAGKVRLNRQPLDVAKMLRDVLDKFTTRSEGRALTLTTRDPLPRVVCDHELISLALRQLIDNALKYSPSRTPIEVSAGAEADQVRISIRDHGPGIPDRDRERIFDKFHRRKNTQIQVPGSGLGLYIAREIARAHGGDLWLEESTGTGSEFCIVLPVPEESKKS